MKQLFGPRTVSALLFAVGIAGLSFVLGQEIELSLVVLVGCVAAVLLAAAPGEAGDGRRQAPAEPRTDPLEPIIEALVEPVLVVLDNRVRLANSAACQLLGSHILGEDVRLAIRHPAAAEGLLKPADLQRDAPIHLVGLGARDQRWEMRVTAMPSGERLVHLADRTGSYAAERMRVDFVANASHELRTPLAALAGFIETLRDGAGEDPETRDRFLKVMASEAGRMQRLIDDLISLSRIEAEKYRAPDQAVDLRKLTHEVCDQIRKLGTARIGDVVEELSDVPPVKGDPTQLSQLLHNLVNNAIKYGRAGTPVTVRLARDGNAMVMLSVSDEGEGIAPEHIPRLTERFYRADPGRSRALGGTGLGLSIVKHIVERHRGRLDIASTPGTGTTVSVMLPAADTVMKLS